MSTKQPQWTYVEHDYQTNVNLESIIFYKVFNNGSYWNEFEDEELAKIICDKFNRLSALEEREKMLTEALALAAERFENASLDENVGIYSNYAKEIKSLLIKPQDNGNGAK